MEPAVCRYNIQCADFAINVHQRLIQFSDPIAKSKGSLPDAPHEAEVPQSVRALQQFRQADLTVQHWLCARSCTPTDRASAIDELARTNNHNTGATVSKGTSAVQTS